MDDEPNPPIKDSNRERLTISEVLHAERIVRSRKGVTHGTIDLDPDTLLLRAIHVTSIGALSPKRLVGDIESALINEARIRVSHQKIRIVPQSILRESSSNTPSDSVPDA